MKSRECSIKWKSRRSTGFIEDWHVLMLTWDALISIFYWLRALDMKFYCGLLLEGWKIQKREDKIKGWNNFSNNFYRLAQFQIISNWNWSVNEFKFFLEYIPHGRSPIWMLYTFDSYCIATPFYMLNEFDPHSLSSNFFFSGWNSNHTWWR